jgi:hypothetical protein
MRKLLLQLDSSPLPSVFDRVVGYDGGADEILSYGGVTADAVRDLVHGLMFTRGPKELRHSAGWVGGTSMPDGERLLEAVQATFFGPLRTSVMLDSNGSNTTAVAAFRKLAATVDDVRGRRIVITAGTGPVGARAAGLFARAGAEVTLTSRSAEEGERVVAQVQARFAGAVRAVTMRDASEARTAIDGAELLLNCGPAGVPLVPRDAWVGRDGLVAVADLNAVPPLGIDGIDPKDDGTARDGVRAFGAMGIGRYKMTLHKACIARLFTRNDLVLDAETIDDVAGELPSASA